MQRLIWITIWVLVLSSMLVGVAHAQEGENEGTTEASIALLLAPLLAAATAVERGIEGIFTLIESAILSLSTFTNLGGQYVKWAKEQVKRYREQLLKMEGDPVQIRAVEKLLQDAEQRLRDWLKSAPYVNMKRSATLVLGILISGFLSLTEFLRLNTQLRKQTKHSDTLEKQLETMRQQPLLEDFKPETQEQEKEEEERSNEVSDHQLHT